MSLGFEKGVFSDEAMALPLPLLGNDNGDESSARHELRRPESGHSTFSDASDGSRCSRVSRGSTRSVSSLLRERMNVSKTGTMPPPHLPPAARRPSPFQEHLLQSNTLLESKEKEGEAGPAETPCSQSSRGVDTLPTTTDLSVSHVADTSITSSHPQGTAADILGDFDLDLDFGSDLSDASPTSIGYIPTPTGRAPRPQRLQEIGTVEPPNTPAVLKMEKQHDGSSASLKHTTSMEQSPSQASPALVTETRLPATPAALKYHTPADDVQAAAVDARLHGDAQRDPDALIETESSIHFTPDAKIARPSTVSSHKAGEGSGQSLTPAAIKGFIPPPKSSVLLAHDSPASVIVDLPPTPAALKQAASMPSPAEGTPEAAPCAARRTSVLDGLEFDTDSILSDSSPTQVPPSPQLTLGSFTGLPDDSLPHQDQEDGEEEKKSCAEAPEGSVHGTDEASTFNGPKQVDEVHTSADDFVDGGDDKDEDEDDEDEDEDEDGQDSGDDGEDDDDEDNEDPVHDELEKEGGAGPKSGLLTACLSRGEDSPSMQMPTIEQMKKALDEYAAQEKAEAAAKARVQAEVNEDSIRYAILNRLEKRDGSPEKKAPAAKTVKISEAPLFGTSASPKPQTGKISPRTIAQQKKEASITETELVLHEKAFGLEFKALAEIAGTTVDAVVGGISSSSPCAGYVGVGDQVVAINGYRVTGLSFRAIVFLVHELEKVTSRSRATTLRFRHVPDGQAPRVLRNSRFGDGIVRLPDSLIPLLQGPSSTSKPGVKHYVEPQVEVHFTPGRSIEAPLIRRRDHEKTTAHYIDVTFTSAPLGIYFAKGTVRKVMGTIPRSQAAISVHLGDILVAVNTQNVHRWGAEHVSKHLQAASKSVSKDTPLVLRFLRKSAEETGRTISRRERLENQAWVRQIQDRWKPNFSDGEADKNVCACGSCRPKAPVKRVESFTTCGTDTDSAATTPCAAASPAKRHQLFDAGVMVSQNTFAKNSTVKSAITQGQPEHRRRSLTGTEAVESIGEVKKAEKPGSRKPAPVGSRGRVPSGGASGGGRAPVQGRNPLCARGTNGRGLGTTGALGGEASPVLAGVPSIETAAPPSSGVEFLEKEVIVNQRLIGLTFEYGVKWKGHKYDAVLKRVKPSSPFADELRCGDRLVAINGQRVSEATGRQTFSAIVHHLNKLLENVPDTPFSLSFRSCLHKPEEVTPLSPHYRFSPSKASKKKRDLAPVVAMMSHKETDDGTLVHATVHGTPVGIVIKDLIVESVHVGTIGEYIAKPGDRIYAVNGRRTDGVCLETVSRMLKVMHQRLTKRSAAQTLTFLRTNAVARVPGFSETETKESGPASSFPEHFLTGDAEEGGETDAVTIPPSADEPLSSAEKSSSSKDDQMQERVILGFSQPPSSITFASLHGGNGARVAFCQTGTVVSKFLRGHDILMSVDGESMTDVPTSEIRHILARNTTAGKPFRMLEFKPTNSSDSPSSIHRRGEQDSVAI